MDKLADKIRDAYIDYFMRDRDFNMRNVLQLGMIWMKDFNKR